MPTHNLKQCWHVEKWTPKIKFHWTSNKYTEIISLECLWKFCLQNIGVFVKTAKWEALVAPRTQVQTVHFKKYARDRTFLYFAAIWYWRYLRHDFDFENSWIIVSLHLHTAYFNFFFENGSSVYIGKRHPAWRKLHSGVHARRRIHRRHEPNKKSESYPL